MWIVDNKEWLFSGIGITIIGAILNFFYKKNNNKNIQKAGKNSIQLQNITASRDVNVEDSKKK